MEQEKEFDLRGTSFCIGMPMYGTIPAQTVISLVDTVREFNQQGIDLALTYEMNNSIIQNARNNIVHNFLNKSGADKLICIDSDIVWKTEDLIRLCCWSTVFPFVGAMYPTKNETYKFIGQYGESKGSLEVKTNQYGLLKMRGFGMGFVIIDRSVFEKMKPFAPLYNHNTEQNVHRFFDIDLQDGHLRGEDIYFMNQWIDKAGGEIWVDPNIELGHVGTKVYSAKLKNALVAVNTAA